MVIRNIQKAKREYPEIVKEYCHSCKKYMNLIYYDMQEDYLNEGQYYPLYNCLTCNSTNSCKGLEKEVS